MCKFEVGKYYIWAEGIPKRKPILILSVGRKNNGFVLLEVLREKRLCRAWFREEYYKEFK